MTDQKSRQGDGGCPRNSLRPWLGSGVDGFKTDGRGRRTGRGLATAWRVTMETRFLRRPPLVVAPADRDSASGTPDKSCAAVNTVLAVHGALAAALRCLLADAILGPAAVNPARGLSRLGAAPRYALR